MYGLLPILLPPMTQQHSDIRHGHTKAMTHGNSPFQENSPPPWSRALQQIHLNHCARKCPNGNGPTNGPTREPINGPRRYFRAVEGRAPPRGHKSATLAARQMAPRRATHRAVKNARFSSLYQPPRPPFSVRQQLSSSSTHRNRPSGNRKPRLLHRTSCPPLNSRRIAAALLQILEG